MQEILDLGMTALDHAWNVTTGGSELVQDQNFISQKIQRDV